MDARTKLNTFFYDDVHRGEKPERLLNDVI